MREHWPEYAIEAGGIAAFLVAAVTGTVVLEHPGSPLHAALPDPLLRRVLMGLAMGATAMALVYSPWGRRSGAHFNPAFTLAFLRLGKVAPRDAGAYVGAHFAGGIAGAALASAVLGALPAHPSVRFAVTLPGAAGPGYAFAAETAISFGLMLTVLVVSNTPRVAPFTGVCCAVLIAAYISLEAPLSGMSMNPARTLGSATGARVFTSIWIYFTAPLAGMLLAAEAYVRLAGAGRVHCAKLQHDATHRCIFRCTWGMQP
jgi:aquaporin Z